MDEIVLRRGVFRQLGAVLSPAEIAVYLVAVAVKIETGTMTVDAIEAVLPGAKKVIRKMRLHGKLPAGGAIHLDRIDEAVDAKRRGSDSPWENAKKPIDGIWHEAETIVSQLRVYMPKKLPSSWTQAQSAAAMAWVKKDKMTAEKVAPYFTWLFNDPWSVRWLAPNVDGIAKAARYYVKYLQHIEEGNGKSKVRSHAEMLAEASEGPFVSGEWR